MSKASVRKIVARMDQQKLVELVMDLYSLKEAKRYLESLFDPHFEEDLEKAKETIYKEFAPGRRSKKRFTAAKKVITEFRQINPPTEYVADLMLELPKVAAEVAGEWYVTSYEFNVSIANNLRTALKFICDNQLQQNFKDRILDILDDMKSVGYFGYDTVYYAIKEYCPEIFDKE